MSSIALGFAGNNDPVQQKDVVRHVARIVTGFGVNEGAARKAAANALVRGRDVGDPQAILRAITSTYAGRSLFDLIVPLCQLARQMPLRQREVAEQAAFRLMTEVDRMVGEREPDGVLTGEFA